MTFSKIRAVDEKHNSIIDIGNFDYDNYLKDLNDVYSSLDLEGFKKELDVLKDSSIFILLKSKSKLSSDEISSLAEYAYSEHNVLDFLTLEYLSKEYINKNETLRKRIIIDYPEFIEKVENITLMEAFDVVGKSGHVLQHVIGQFKKYEKDLISHHILSGHRVTLIPNYVDHLTESNMMYTIACSKNPEIELELYKDHPNFNSEHISLILTKNPDLIGKLEFVDKYLAEIYCQNLSNEETENEILKLYNSWKTMIPIPLHPLFINGVVQYKNYYIAYRDLYNISF